MLLGKDSGPSSMEQRGDSSWMSLNRAISIEQGTDSHPLLCVINLVNPCGGMESLPFEQLHALKIDVSGIWYSPYSWDEHTCGSGKLCSGCVIEKLHHPFIVFPFSIKALNFESHVLSRSNLSTVSFTSAFLRRSSKVVIVFTHTLGFYVGRKAPLTN